MKTSKMIEMAFLVACGIVLQIVESFLPTSWILPGFKLGFANIVGLFAWKRYGVGSMWTVNLTRVFLASLLQGTLFSVAFWLSLSGSLCSMLMMSIGIRTRWFSIFGISILGAAFHSVGQVLMVTWIYQQYFMQLFLPILLALSIVSGLLIGLLTQLLIQRWKGRTV
ncbi:Gx transporter family protein [uncultured Faecalicoccus sp.]|uniref:Gx transporter family protein n=1 Tax=uncultured Faecalicoccus sp. TaxID=1971760 RepID=UPI002627917A|nr:Gx transporter family protein [uncultured Faecalicoccus sp.]